MPIWGEWKITWRQVAPPILILLGLACAAYTVSSCLRRDRSGIVANREQIRFYLSQLGSTDAATRAAAARLLGEQNDPSVIPELRKLLPDPDPRVVGAACGALGELGDAASTDAIFSHISDDNPSLAAGAAQGLGALRCEKAVDPLLGHLQSPDAELRRAAIVALGRIGGPAAVKALEAIRADPCQGLDPPPSDSERDRLAAAVEEALARLAPPEDK